MCAMLADSFLAFFRGLISSVPYTPELMSITPAFLYRFVLRWSDVCSLLVRYTVEPTSSLCNYWLSCLWKCSVITGNCADNECNASRERLLVAGSTDSVGVIMLEYDVQSNEKSMWIGCCCWLAASLCVMGACTLQSACVHTSVP